MTLNGDPNALLADASLGSDEDPDDSSYGWAMFLAFATAVLAITFAVCALAMVGSWWMLGVVYGADLAITAMVMRVVYGAFRSPAYPDWSAPSQRPEQSPRSSARTSMRAHAEGLAVEKEFGEAGLR